MNGILARIAERDGRIGIGGTTIMADDTPTVLTEDRRHAPIIYFEAAPVRGYVNGLAKIGLSAGLQLLNSDGKTVRTEGVMTAYLVSNLVGMKALRDLIDEMIRDLTPPADAKPN